MKISVKNLKWPVFVFSILSSSFSFGEPNLPKPDSQSSNSTPHAEKQTTVRAPASSEDAETAKTKFIDTLIDEKLNTRN